MGTSRLVLKEIHVLARLFEPGDFLALPSDDVAKKDMEVGDIERAVSPVHRTIGHVFENLLPGLDLLLQRLLVRMVDDERCLGRGGLVADAFQMLSDIGRVEKLENVRTYGVDAGAGRCAIWLQAVVYDRSIRPMFATAGVIVQLFREFEHKGAIIGQVADIAFGGVERRGCEVVEEAVREIPQAEIAFLNAVDFARIGAPNLAFERTIVVVFEHDGETRAVVEGPTVDLDDVAGDPGSVKDLTIGTEVLAIVPRQVIDALMRSPLIPAVAQKDQIASHGCGEYQRGLSAWAVV